jgi:glutamate-1-semialdehyde 2,1-aminomutase
MSESSQRDAATDLALNAAREVYLARNPFSMARYLEAVTVMPGGNTSSDLHVAPFPLAMARAEGCRMWDADGHSYIDFLGGHGAGLYGHSDPVIGSAVQRALADGTGLGTVNLLEARFARAVCERFGLQLVRFTVSGAEAALLAVAVARRFTLRRKVLVFAGGNYFDVGAGGAVEVVAGTYNDVEGTRALIADDLALVLVEPLSGGASVGFLSMLREATAEVGALLAFDEVVTSRLAPGGLQSVVGVLPDLTVLGGYLGGGMPFGALGGRRAVLDRFDTRRFDALPHAGTFNNAVLTMAAGLAGLSEVYTPAAAVALTARGEVLRGRLNAVCADVPLVFTGFGSLLGLSGGAKLRALLFFDMLARGIWLAPSGAMALSLPVGDAECDALVAAVEDFVAARRALLG